MKKKLEEEIATVSAGVDAPDVEPETIKDGASTYKGSLFGMIIYPEAMEKIGWTQQDLITFIQGFEPKKWYARIHDKDVWTKEEENEHKAKWEKEHGGKPLLPADIEEWEAHKAGRLKKPHYHVVMKFLRPRKIQPIRDRLSADRLGTVSGWVSWHKAIRYLCHTDNKHKAQYSPDGVFGYSSRYLDECEYPLDPEDIRLEINKELNREPGITNFYAFLKWANKKGAQYGRYVEARPALYAKALESKVKYLEEKKAKGKQTKLKQKDSDPKAEQALNALAGESAYYSANHWQAPAPEPAPEEIDKEAQNKIAGLCAELSWCDDAPEAHPLPSPSKEKPSEMLSDAEEKALIGEMRKPVMEIRESAQQLPQFVKVLHTKGFAAHADAGSIDYTKDGAIKRLAQIKSRLWIAKSSILQSKLRAINKVKLLESLRDSFNFCCSELSELEGLRKYGDIMPF